MNYHKCRNSHKKEYNALTVTLIHTFMVSYDGHNIENGLNPGVLVVNTSFS